MSEASVSPRRLEAQSHAALRELARAQRIIDPRAYLLPLGFCAFELGVFAIARCPCVQGTGNQQSSSTP